MMPAVAWPWLAGFEIPQKWGEGEECVSSQLSLSRCCLILSHSTFRQKGGLEEVNMGQAQGEGKAVWTKAYCVGGPCRGLCTCFPPLHLLSSMTEAS